MWVYQFYKGIAKRKKKALIVSAYAILLGRIIHGLLILILYYDKWTKLSSLLYSNNKSFYEAQSIMRKQFLSFRPYSHIVHVIKYCTH